MGEIQTLIAHVVSQVDNIEVLYTIINAAPDIKLSYVLDKYRNEDIRICALYYFSIHSLFNRQTYTSEEETSIEYRGKNKYMKKIYAIAACAVSGDITRLLDEIDSIPIASYLKCNKIEAGYVIGFTMQLICRPNDLLTCDIREGGPEEREIHMRIVRLRVRLLFKPLTSMLFSFETYKTGRGILLSLQCNLLCVNSILSSFSMDGCVIYKSSPLIRYMDMLHVLDASHTLFTVSISSINTEFRRMCLLNHTDSGERAYKRIDKDYYRNALHSSVNNEIYKNEKMVIKDKIYDLSNVDNIGEEPEITKKKIQKYYSDIAQLRNKYPKMDNNVMAALEKAFYPSWNAYNRQHTRDMHTLYSSYTSLYSSIRHTQSTAHYSHILSSCILLHNICMSYRCLHLFRHTLSSLIKGTFSLT